MTRTQQFMRDNFDRLELSGVPDILVPYANHLREVGGTPKHPDPIITSRLSAIYLEEFRK